MSEVKEQTVSKVKPVATISSSDIEQKIKQVQQANKDIQTFQKEIEKISQSYDKKEDDINLRLKKELENLELKRLEIKEKYKQLVINSNKERKDKIKETEQKIKDRENVINKLLR